MGNSSLYCPVACSSFQFPPLWILLLLQFHPLRLWDHVLCLEGKLHSISQCLSFSPTPFHMVLSWTVFMFLPFVTASHPSSQPRCKFWPIFTVPSHFSLDCGVKWEPDAFIHVAIIPGIQMIMAVSGKILWRWELCRRQSCFVFCLCTLTTCDSS